MMSKKQWSALVCLYIIYIFLGTFFFYHIQSEDESIKRAANKEERTVIEALLYKHYLPSPDSPQEDIFSKLRDYCGKPMTADEDVPIIWDFLHSLFFVITVVTTVGYGNIAPTTMLGRICMMFYALIGIPLNGMVMVTLGEYFAKSFKKLYSRWKSTKVHYHASRIGLIGQVILYLIPGFTFFIFIPSVVIMIFEEWDYDVAVYYSFVTLTTIGFGDYVPTYVDNNFNRAAFLIYRILLLIWILIGLGYGVMIIGFISKGLHSKRMHALEHMLAERIKKTPTRIRALRSLVHEILLMRVKPVYKRPFLYTPTLRERSQSCPDLELHRNMDSPTMVRRKRAFSAVDVPPEDELPRIQSDSDLTRIDMELTFQPENQQNELLRRVANALGNYETMQSSNLDRHSISGIDGFSDEEILASERYNSKWAMDQRSKDASPYSMSPRTRKRAASEVRYPFGGTKEESNNDLTWYGTSATKKLQEMREIAKHGRARSRTLSSPPQELNITTSQPSLFSRLLKSFSREDKTLSLDVEKQEYSIPIPSPKPLHFQRSRAFSVAPDSYLHQTRHGRPSTHSVREEPILEDRIAELLLALTSPMNIPGPTPDTVTPKRKMGTASLTPPSDTSPPVGRRLAVRQPFHQTRRQSLMPTTSTGGYTRRLSLLPDTNLLSVGQTQIPPPYSPLPPNIRNIRRFSLRPVGTSSPSAYSPSVTRRNIARNKTTFKDQSADKS